MVARSAQPLAIGSGWSRMVQAEALSSSGKMISIALTEATCEDSDRMAEGIEAGMECR